jgi:hypothetical protein
MKWHTPLKDIKDRKTGLTPRQQEEIARLRRYSSLPSTGGSAGMTSGDVRRREETFHIQNRLRNAPGPGTV